MCPYIHEQHFVFLTLYFLKIKQKSSYLYINTNPWVMDNYFFNQKVRGYSLRLDLYVYEWKHILYRNKVPFAFSVDKYFVTIF